jgi:hypothetical protein
MVSDVVIVVAGGVVGVVSVVGWLQCGKLCPSAFNSFELPSWMLYQDVQLLWDSGLVGVKAATRC